jgi:hypothetical protein
VISVGAIHPKMILTIGWRIQTQLRGAWPYRTKKGDCFKEEWQDVLYQNSAR